MVKAISILPLAAATMFAARPVPPQEPTVTQGSLMRIDPYSKHTGELCPLRHTAVRAEISGFLARVTVTQKFRNESPDKIEAVYIFPLPPKSAVDDMVMKVGSRTVKAVIKQRDEARKIFEQARNQGHTASLLEQERPNIFTQTVTNIEPGAAVDVTISYVEVLPYEEGSYEFSFPMTVGPRYIPAHAPDAAKVNPKYAPPATRAGHDLSMEVIIDAGVPIDSFRSGSHEVATERTGAGKARVTLKQASVIPNKDFVLKYDVAGTKVQDALMTHRGSRGGYFTFILQPPERVTVEDVTPKELVFVIDTSGSMSGFPIEKAKETMKLAMDGLYPRDTFNLITFAGDTHLLFPQPVPATPENLRKAQEFLAGRRGGGGTEMLKAIRAALAPSGDRDAIRIVCFMTDGYVGNDFEIVEEVKRNSGARVFSFGIGSSVNKFLLDKMAEAGRGEVEYVSLQDDGSAAARRFHERVRNPLLTDITLEWNGLPVVDVYPARVPDLFSAKPVTISGRFTAAGSGVLRVKGRMSGRPWSRDIRVNLPASEPQHDVLATLWARTRIEHLMNQAMGNFQNGTVPKEIENDITRLGLEHRLMTQFTSFVAVEEKTVTREGKPVRIEVPVELPDGVSHEGNFGMKDEADYRAAKHLAGRTFAQVAPATAMIRTDSAVSGPRTKANESAALVREVKDAAELVEVEIWLVDGSAELIDKIKRLGFLETKPSKIAKIRTGKIRRDKLAELEKLDGVVRVVLKPQQ
jgi:Ca-activated chloride channel family protein